MKHKVQKILSEIATRKLCTMDEHMAFYNDKAKEDYGLLSEIEEFIKASQEEPVSEELGDYINELSNQFPEVSFAKLSRIAVRVANWQKEQLMKNAIELPLYLDGDFLTVDYDFTESGYKVDDKVKMIIIKEE